MRKSYLRTLAFLPILAIGLNAWADKKIGDLKQVDGFYEIGSLEDMKAFSDAVKEGQMTINARLTADLDGFTEDYMVPTYEGHFDGQGHIITTNINAADEQGIAIFKYIQNGAVIENIGARGTIKGSNKLVASIVGDMYESTVRNCWSTVELYNSVVGDATSGGLIARIRTAPSTVENCIFAGSLTGPDAFKCGGLVGYLSKPGVMITNCVVMGTYQLADNDNNTFNRKPENAIYTNCYYLESSRFATVSDACQPVTAEQIASGELCFLLNGDQTAMKFYQNLGEDAFPVPNSSHATVYSTANVSCDGTISDAGGYTNDADKAGKVQDHNYQDGFCTICGTMDQNYLTADAEGWFNIGSAEALHWFAAYVNDGNNASNARLTADIDMSNMTYGPEGMIGLLNLGYAGTFDGNGHTVNVAFTNTAQGGTEASTCSGLFRCVSGATIRNIIVTGTIDTNQKFAGGLVGKTVEKACTFENVASFVTLNSSLDGDGTHGGLLGLAEANATFINALSGTVINGEATNSCGGLVGWASQPCSFTNCAVIGALNVLDSGCATFSRNYGSNTYKNCYYQEGVKAIGDNGKGKQVKKEEVANGSLCFKLNGNSFDAPKWFQTIDEDDYPVFDPTHAVVYGFGDEYGCVVDGNVDELKTKLAAYETSFVEELIAQASLKEAYLKDIEAIESLSTLDAVAKAYNDLLASKKTLQACADAYSAYMAKVEETKKYLEEDKSFTGAVREALEDYLSGNEGPSEENPNGQAEYIVENQLLGTDEIKAETARIDEWLNRAMISDAKPGQDVTVMLTNPDFSNNFTGWQGRGGSGVSKAGAMPVAYSAGSTSDRYQTLTGLKNGIYELQMHAMFFPYRNVSGVLNANYGAMLYAGENEIPVKVVREDALIAAAAQNQQNCYIDNVNTLPYDFELRYQEDGDVYYVPSHETGASYAFSANRYLNRVLVNVTDGTLKVGLRVDGTSAGGYLATYANTRLIYQGELESSEAFASLDAVLSEYVARATTTVENYEPSDGDDYKQRPNFSAALKEQLKQLIAKASASSQAAEKYELMQQFTAVFKEIYVCKKAYADMYAQSRILNSLNVEGLLSEEESAQFINAIVELETAYSEGGYTTQQAQELEAFKDVIPEQKDGYYQLASPLNWVYWTYVLNNISNSAKAQLTADIDMSPQDMTPVNMFTGELDGQGHTLNIYMVSKGGDGYAPFRETRGCYIHDLNITGRIDGRGDRKITSLIGNNKEKPFTIERVSSAVTIISSYGGDSSICGFCADNRDVNGTCKIKDCLSTITIDAPSATNRGGLMGWNKSPLECENVLVASVEPEDIVNSSTIIRQSSSELTKFTNCYYLRSMPTKQGTKVTEEQLASGEICYLLQAGREVPVWLQTLGEDKTPVLLQDHKLVVKTASGYENAENAIRQVSEVANTNENGNIYDLTGRRVGKARKGIYIRGGQKVLIR